VCSCEVAWCGVEGLMAGVGAIQEHGDELVCRASWCESVPAAGGAETRGRVAH
jgi:hypothetical protein